MYVLDTNVVSNVLAEDRAYDRLRQRVRQEWDRSYISVVTIEECIVDGALPLINDARRRGRSLLGPYAVLEGMTRKLASFQVLPYDDAAERAFQGMTAPLRRHHPADCRIGATALSRGFTLVTMNLAHFQRIPGLRCEDWNALDPDEIPPPDWAL